MSTRPIVLDDRREQRLYDHSVVLRLAKYLRGHGRLLTMGLASICVYSATVVTLPWLVKLVVDSYVQARDVSAIDLAGAAYLIVATVQMATSYFHNRLNVFVSFRVIQQLRDDAFSHIHRLSMSFFDRNEAGRVMSRVQNDTREVEGFVSLAVMSLARHPQHSRHRSGDVHNEPRAGDYHPSLRAYPHRRHVDLAAPVPRAGIKVETRVCRCQRPSPGNHIRDQGRPESEQGAR